MQRNNYAGPLIRKLNDGNEAVRVAALYALCGIIAKGTIDMGRVVDPL